MKSINLNDEEWKVLELIITGNPQLQPKFPTHIVKKLQDHGLVRVVSGGTLTATQKGQELFVMYQRQRIIK